MGIRRIVAGNGILNGLMIWQVLSLFVFDWPVLIMADEKFLMRFGFLTFSFSISSLICSFIYVLQNFQGQGLMRVSQVGSPGSSSPNTSQGVQSFNQPWLSSGSQGKPPLPPPSTYRPQMNTPSMQQRSHIPQQHSPLSTNLQQQHLSSVQPQQSKPSHQLPDHYGQQFSSPRVPQSSPHQQQITRPPGSATQKPSSLALVQPNAVQTGNQSKIAGTESDEFGNRILTKRSIQELVNQVKHIYLLLIFQIRTSRISKPRSFGIVSSFDFIANNWK